jgi:hypothetical protein
MSKTFRRGAVARAAAILLTTIGVATVLGSPAANAVRVDNNIAYTGSIDVFFDIEEVKLAATSPVRSSELCDRAIPAADAIVPARVSMASCAPTLYQCANTSQAAGHWLQIRFFADRQECAVPLGY